MIITYHKNPLKTTVELNEHEKKELWYKIKLEEYEDIIFEVQFCLKDGKYFNLERARIAVESDEVCRIDKRVNELLECYLAELMGSHCGDCTAVPCSCTKCHAEDMLGINTTKGLRKHEGYNIAKLFSENSEKTLDEAIEHLAANLVPIKGIEWDGSSQEEFDSHVPEWTEDSKKALEWLRNYRSTHFTEFQWRLVAGLALINGSLFWGGFFLIAAEGLGVLEELV